MLSGLAKSSGFHASKERSHMKPTTTDKDGHLRLQDQVCFSLYSASRMVTKAHGLLLKELGVTYPQYLALLMLWEQDGILVSEIAAALEIDAGTATPLMQRLEKLGLVERVRCDQDERRVRVYLTALGKASYDKALSVPDGLGEAMGLDPENARRLVAEMQMIKAQITKWLDPEQT